MKIIRGNKVIIDCLDLDLATSGELYCSITEELGSCAKLTGELDDCPHETCEDGYKQSEYVYGQWLLGR